MPGNGCHTNCFVLHETIRSAKSRKQSGLVVTMIDLEKALDTVSHDAIWASLSAGGFGDAIVRAVRAVYDGANTVFSGEGL